MKAWVIIVLAIILIPILVLGYLGFMPGVSDLMGTNRPRDLGVRYTEADLKSVFAKNGMTIVNLPQDSPVWVRYEGKRELKNTRFTQEEITARVNNAADTYKYAGVHDLQVKFNPDGSFESSGRADLNMLKFRAEDLATKFHVPAEAKKALMGAVDAVAPLQPEPPFYVKGALSVTNNQIDFVPESAELGKVPLDQVPKDAVVRIVEQAINEVPGLNVRSLKVVDGQMVFDGTIPEKTYQIPSE
jgi:hypothetical protein